MSTMALGILLLIGFLNWSVTGTREVYNIAHMTNTPAAVEWAIRQGANGVEIDLTFDVSTGQPIKFYHGGFCDCSCMCPLGTDCSSAFPNSVCVLLQEDSSNACEVETPFDELLMFLAKQHQLAVIVIESKVKDTGMSVDTMRIAAQRVVDGLRTNLFNTGYRGQVVIGSSNLETVPYLRSAIEAVNRGLYSDRVYYAIDMLEIGESLTALHQLPTRNFVYGTGLSACVPSPFDTTNLQLAALNSAEVTVGMTYIWSVDKASTMRSYLPYVSAVMSNYPGIVRDVIQEFGLQLASPSSHIPTASSRNIITTVQPCECWYQEGGCTIHRPAPEGVACQCTYSFLWTCSEYIVQCKDPSSRYCQHPDTSVESCRQGSGDCGGY